MTPRGENYGKQSCRSRLMVNADKLSTEHTLNTLSITLKRPASVHGVWDQTACKPGSVPTVPGRTRNRRGGHSSGPALADRFSRPTRIPRAGDGPTRPQKRAGAGSLFPYSVLLLAGLAVPSMSPPTRWALTPPFHPSRSGERRFAFCGAIPRVAPGGRYPPPCRRGARTFLEPCGPRPPGRLIRRDQ